MPKSKEINTGEKMPPWLKSTNCPHCGKKLEIDFSLSINSVREGLEQDTVAGDDRFTPHERQLLEDAKANGLLVAFSEAAAASNPTAGVPNSVEKMFLVFLKIAAPKRVPKFVIEAFTKEFPGTLWFNAANGILSVSSDGVIRAFFPQRLAVGAKIGKLGSSASSLVSRMPADEKGFEQWIRTKHGYVIGKGAYWEQMQKRSKGEFMDVIL